MREQINKYKIFTKVSWDKNSIIYYSLLIFVSFFYGIMFNVDRIKLLSESGNIDILLVLYSISCCLLFFFILMLSKYVFIIFMPILFYIASVSYIYATKLSMDTDKFSSPLFFSYEVISHVFYDIKNIIFVSLLVILSVILSIVRVFINDFSSIRKGQIFAIIVIVFFSFLSIVREDKKKFSPMPIAYLVSINNHFSDKISNIIFGNKKEGKEIIIEH